MRGHFRQLITWLALSMPLLVSGQYGFVGFENVSAKLGDLYEPIESCLEDHLGFLWFATQTGLYQYDGYQLKAFQHHVYDSTSLSSSTIWHIAEDHEGHIWVATTYGINLLDRRTGTFKRFLPFPEVASNKARNTIQLLHFGQDARCWVAGPHTLYLFETSTGVFQEVLDTEGSPVGHSIHSILEEKNGTILCGTSDGLLRILPNDTVFTHVSPDPDSASVFNKDIVAIAEGDNGELWLATAGGLARYSPENGTLRTALYAQDPEPDALRGLIRTRDGTLWLSFRGSGVGMYHPGSKTLHRFEHSTANARSLQNNTVRCMMEDQFGNVWLGTSAGISKVSGDRSGFRLIQNVNQAGRRANTVERILEDRDGALWMKTADGMYTWSEEEGSGHPVAGFSGIQPEDIGDWLYEGQSGQIWVPIIGHGFMVKDPGANQFSQLEVDPGLAKTKVYKILEDSRNNHLLWIGTSDGLCALDVRSGATTWYLPRDQLDVPSNRFAIFDQRGDEIWLYYTYFNSLGRFTKATGQFELFRPPAETQYVLEGTIRDIAITADNNVWLATVYGLARFNIGDTTFNIYTRRDGLPDDVLNAVLVDQKDRVWVSGDQFLAVFDRQKAGFNTYFAGDAIKSFWNKSKFLATDGRIYFGGLNGVYTFHPDSLRRNLIPPKVVLTDFRVKDSTYLLNEPFGHVSKIILSHKQNDIAFEFAGIHFIAPEAVRHRCMLVGYDEGWHNLGYTHSVNYTNLNPGRYTFRADAANRDGIWSDNGLSVELVITPPFTKTPWFRALIGLIAILILYTVYRIWHYQQLLRRQKELAEQAADYRMRFLSHVSHEIRTPMNAIIGLSKLAKETQLDERQQEYMTAIEQSSENLLSIINELLDHSKVEAGMFSFVSQEFSLRVVLDQLRGVFQTLAHEKGITFGIEVAKGVPDALVGDGLRLGQILTNLLGNAIKFTSEGGVTLRINSASRHEDKATLKFAVEDTGAGIPEDYLDQVFERFRNAPRDSWYSGSGLGLYITRALVEQQGGTIGIESKVDQGTQITVQMSFGVIAEMTSRTTVPVQDYEFGPLHVLIVDDSPMNHLVMQEMLKKRIPHVQLTTANDGQEAVDLVASNDFDVVVMDARMPGMDGLTATRHIRASAGPHHDVPILGATAGAMATQIQDCLDSGMNDVVTKPVQIDVLMEKLFSLTQSTPE